ncbi:MAG: hypothetical protein H5T98_05880 [Syntrophomonadaceae bacterium]|nr:hypothetical protein [Syntrophomonadaceae bacterium]
MKNKWMVIIATIVLLGVITSMALAGNPIRLIVNGQKYESLLKEQPPTIESIEFYDENNKPIKANAGWFELGDYCNVKVKLNGTITAVEFYVTPTGTETYNLKKFVGAVPSSGTNTVNFKWEVPENLLGYFEVVAYNGPLGRKSSPLKIISRL